MQRLCNPHDIAGAGDQRITLRWLIQMTPIAVELLGVEYESDYRVWR